MWGSIKRIALVSAAVVVPLLSIGAGVSAAAPSVGLGGGSGIVLNDELVCSLTTIGYDGAGRLVGLTAGHCGPPGASVASERQYDAGTVGRITESDPALDYAVIQFDGSRVVPLKTVGATTINAIGPDPVLGDLACKDGRTTGRDCGIVWGPSGYPAEVLNQTCSQPGDSGGPVLVNGRLVGMNNGNIINSIGGLTFDVRCTNPANPIHNPAYSHSITAILGDINAGGGVGAGFAPVG